MNRFLLAMLLMVSCIGFTGCGGGGDQGPPSGPMPENVPAEDDSAAEAKP
jgi:hypothetical protein